jgi:hypothetical protein
MEFKSSSKSNKSIVAFVRKVPYSFKAKDLVYFILSKIRLNVQNPIIKCQIKTQRNGRPLGYALVTFVSREVFDDIVDVQRMFGLRCANTYLDIKESNRPLKHKLVNFGQSITNVAQGFQIGYPAIDNFSFQAVWECTETRNENVKLELLCRKKPHVAFHFLCNRQEHIAEFALRHLSVLFAVKDKNQNRVLIFIFRKPPLLYNM